MDYIKVQKIIRRYRERLGINPSYLIHVNIVPESQWPKKYKVSGAGAWIQESATHPEYYINIRKDVLSGDVREVTQLIVHELLHIVFGELLKSIKKNYDYDQDGKLEEKLVMQMARAIVPTKER